MPTNTDATARMPFDRLRLTAPGSGFANPRTVSGLDDESLVELAQSIGRYGLINRLVVTPDGLILAGQRRYRAIALLIDWRNRFTGRHHLTEAEVVLYDARADELQRGVPVEVWHAQSPRGHADVALVDNLQRVDLSSYEVAESVAAMAAVMSQAEIARRVSKSPSWVSRHLTAWTGAGDELAAAWRAGLPFDHVLALAALPHDEQARRLAGGPPKGRGPVNRPGIDTVKSVLREIGRGHHPSEAYLDGIRDALRWVTGQDSSPDFAAILAEVE